MDIRDFVRKQEAALKKYRRIYKLLDFFTITLILYTIMVLLSVDQIFPLINTFEVRAGTSYDAAGLSIAFESVVMLLVSAFFALIVTLLIHLRDDRTGAILLVEEKYPNLRERLRTAYDNLNVDNIIANDLVQIVSANVTKVNSSDFMRKRRVTFGIVILLVSFAALTVITVNDIHTDTTPDDWKDILDNLPGVSEEENPDDLFEIGDEGGEEGDGSDSENLIGEPAVVVVEGKEVDLSLPPGSGVGFSNSEDAEEREEEFQQSSAYEISVISSQAYYEELPDGYESIIKDYFEELAKK
ncbi:hypothetical protein V7O66_05280 [Methanolobus sp. ZRKC3]|uniref:DUF7502 family protein n=1 Tax=Methanolobus sp. ZRKC3 TaxID=3125786 RepID=UPI003245925A